MHPKPIVVRETSKELKKVSARLLKQSEALQNKAKELIRHSKTVRA